MNTLAVVPARAGSREIPGKNKRNFMGKPLVAWAIECGKRTCDRVCVTTNDEDVLDIAEEYGVQALTRPDDLAQDETPMLDVLRHILAMEAKPPDILVLLQATQPLRRDERVIEALELLKLSPDIDSIVSVVPIPQHQSPDYAVFISNRMLVFSSAVSRRQDCRPAYYRDGTVYAMKRRVLEGGAMYGRSAPLVIDARETCTLDTEADWKRAEEIWRKQHDG
jgi:CMP-N,N'-diacetyllegionaminic acid synthase